MTDPQESKPKWKRWVIPLLLLGSLLGVEFLGAFLSTRGVDEPDTAAFAPLGELQGQSVCQDEPDDFEIFFAPDDPQDAVVVPPSFLDLANIELTVTEDQVEVRWTSHVPIPDDFGLNDDSPLEFSSWTAQLFSSDDEVLPEGESVRVALLNVLFSDEGVTVQHQALGEESFFQDFRQDGSFEIDGDTLTATFDIADVAVIPASFSWNATTDAMIRIDASDPTSLVPASDRACLAGLPFPGE